MADMRHNSTGLPLVTDEAKSVDAFYGPWESLGEFGSWWSETFAGVDIPAGTLAGVINDTNVDRYCRIVPAGGTAYWKKLNYINSVIEFGGVVSGVTISSGTAGTMGNRATVFYDEDSDTLLLKSGNSYYGNWTNSYDYGEVDDGRIYPYEGKIYIDITTGQMFYATKADLEPIEGGGSLSQELVEELIRLKSLNIRFSEGVLRLYDSGDDKDKEYNLDEQVVVSYGTPSISFGYGTITSNYSTYSPDENNRLVVTQAVYHNGDLFETLTYKKVVDLKGAFVDGDSLEFKASGTGFSVSASTGKLTITANTDTESRKGYVTLVLKLHGISASHTVEVEQPAEAITLLTAQEILYQTGAISGGNYITIPQIKGSNGTIYAGVTAFNQAGGESLTFECDSLYGATLGFSDGKLTYAPSTVYNAFISEEMTAGDKIIPAITVEAGEATGVHYPDFSSIINTEVSGVFGARISVTEGSTYGKFRVNQSYGYTAQSVEVTAGNTYCIRVHYDKSAKPDKNVSPVLLLVSNAALVTANSVNTTDVVYSSSDYVEDFSDGCIFYKAAANGYITVSMTYGGSNSKVYILEVVGDNEQ